MTDRKRAKLGLLALWFSAGWVCWVHAEEAKEASPKNADPYEACSTCHDSMEGKTEWSAHIQVAAWEKDVKSCDQCHGDPTAHIDDPTLENIQIFDKLSDKDSNKVCLSCHNASEGHKFWKGSPHERDEVACISCHSEHAPKSKHGLLVAKNETELCVSCHLDVRADLWKVSHHPVREGKMSCMDCHNPHGAINESLVAASSVNELCFSCHTEKRGPFLWEHAPVRENCLNCHNPHGSNHLKMQKTSVPYICQECHSNTRHPGTLYDGSRLPTLEDPTTGSNRLFNRACVDCHSAIHGSNHPSGAYLGR